MASIENNIYINKIFLMLGPACNFHCKYCLQENIKHNLQDIVISAELYTYIDNLMKECKYADKELCVIFYGGEPLLYWDTIKEFVLHYKNRLSYGMISNGSLLTEDKVKFIEEHDITLTISHDGPNTELTRGEDVLKNPYILSLTKRIPISFNAVISAYNCDYDEIFSYWESVCPNYCGNIEMFRLTWDMPDDIKNIDLAKYRNGLAKFFQNAVKNIKRIGIPYKAAKAVSIVRSVVRSAEKQTFHFPKCCQTERVLNIDLQGNIYACHNCHDKIGHVTDDRAAYLQNYYRWLETKKKPECDTCKVRYFCQGGCPLDISNETCNLQKILYEEALRSYNENKKIWDKEL